MASVWSVAQMLVEEQRIGVTQRGVVVDMRNARGQYGCGCGDNPGR